MQVTGSVVTLTIDGIPCSATSDQTILDVAREHGVEIPTLCHLDGLTPVGACRLCVVDVEGQRRPQPACLTRVCEGQVVETTNDRLQGYRKMLLEMLFAERNHVCSVCVSNGHCELQDLAVEHGVEHISVPYLYPTCEVDASHPRFVLDHNRCIMCQRCVRVCDEVEGAHVWDVMNRGAESRICTDMGGKWADSTNCTSCGKCVHVCPTGALTEKGKSAGEMAKCKPPLNYLQVNRRH